MSVDLPFLDISYKFHLRNDFQVHLCYSVYQFFIHFYCWFALSHFIIKEKNPPNSNFLNILGYLCELFFGFFELIILERKINCHPLSGNDEDHYHLLSWRGSKNWGTNKYLYLLKCRGNLPQTLWFQGLNTNVHLFVISSFIQWMFRLPCAKNYVFLYCPQRRDM